MILYRGLHGLKEEYDLVIVGAGLSGSVVAEQVNTVFDLVLSAILFFFISLKFQIPQQASSRLGLSSLVIDKRSHIGGNCYDYIDEHGIRVSQYGVHIFHTKYPRVENWVKQFSDFVPYTHR